MKREPVGKAGTAHRIAPGGDSGSDRSPGILYLVATPIGNLEDITLRALRVLGEVDWIAAEDTRRTRILLDHHRIRKPLISHHAHSEHRNAAELVDRLRSGERGALVTDAGTPGISDPGFLLAREARRAGIRVEVVPGASAVLAALLASGMPSEQFCFAGYVPPREGGRRRFLEAALDSPRTIVLFETPHRIEKTLAALAALEPERTLALCREMTKRFEEVLRGTAAALHEELLERPRKGEFTIVLAARAEEGRSGESGSEESRAE
ncbi:MAG: 16S rRNA (cytidine(1402)-2'-O)-methyltransferase [Candidatus Eisenbacteria bacterium]|nr:16S rRNA (cytidine(1402)-2'-O)-methyltransferase [Candidatus Eisenbacteria bacterium]